MFKFAHENVHIFSISQEVNLSINFLIIFLLTVVKNHR